MITVLTGENSFMIQQEVRRTVDEFVAEYSGLALERIDGEEADYDKIREALQSLPFLSGKKLVVLRAPSNNVQFVEYAKALITELPESTDLIITEPKLDKRTAYYKFLKKLAGYKEYVKLEGMQLTKWCITEAASMGGSVNHADATYLISRVGDNQQLLSNELRKLVNHSPQITKQSIDMLTEHTPQSKIFDLLDAALQGNRSRAIELYREQRSQKVETVLIITMLGWQLHILAIIKTAGRVDDNTIAREAKLNPYVVKKSRLIADRLTLERLKRIINDTLALDVRLKSESIDADEALQNLILSL